MINCGAVLNWFEASKILPNDGCQVYWVFSVWYTIFIAHNVCTHKLFSYWIVFFLFWFLVMVYILFMTKIVLCNWYLMALNVERNWSWFEVCGYGSGWVEAWGVWVYPFYPWKKSQSMQVPLITVGGSLTRYGYYSCLWVHPYMPVYPTQTIPAGSGRGRLLVHGYGSGQVTDF